MDRGDVALALALLVGIALTGQLSGLVHSAGYPTLGSLVWPVGYGSIVLTAWYVWIRPLGLRAPGTDEREPWTDPDDSTGPER